MNELTVPHIIAIVNSNDCKNKWQKYNAVLRHYFPRMQTFYTEAAFHAAELTRYHLNSFIQIADPLIILAVGGDRMLNECLNGILGSNFSNSPMIYLMNVPLGTANDFWRSFYKINPKFITPSLITEAIKKCNGVVCDVGLCIATPHESPLAVSGSIKKYFVNVASVGMSAKIAQKTRKSKCKCLGRRVYLWEAFKACIFGHPKNLINLKVDDCEIIDDYLMVAIGNSTSFGGKMHVCPDANPADGILDVSAVRNTSSICKLNHLLSHLYAGNLGLAASSQVSMYKTAEPIKLDPVLPDAEILVECDGEVAGKLPASFEITTRIQMLAL